jgi:hypothetical protein
MERILKYLTAKEWGCAALTRRVAAQIINAIVTHVQAQSYMPGAPQSALQTTATEVRAIRNLEQATRSTCVPFEAYWQLLGNVRRVVRPNRLMDSDVDRSPGNTALSLPERHCVTVVPVAQRHKALLIAICAFNLGPALLREYMFHTLLTWSHDPASYTAILRSHVRPMRAAISWYTEAQRTLDAPVHGEKSHPYHEFRTHGCMWSSCG